jgi:sec-independent protein translocase protein TatB
MEVFNIGPLELLLILVLAVLMFGPEDIVNFAHKAGRWIYNLRKSELWQEIVGTTKEIQEFPQKIMKEAELEETMKEINALNQTMLNSDPPSQAASVAEPDPPPAQAAEEHPEDATKDIHKD